MRALALLGCVAIAGCFAPTLSNGGLSCGSDDHCPPGFHCAADTTCWKNGEDPNGITSDMSVDDLSAIGDGFDVADLSPPVRARGQSCQTGTECATGFCTDGVCCDTACGGSCQACNLALTVGTCTDVPTGMAPSSGHPSCGPDAQSTCMRDGTCDGAGACHLWNNVVCKPGSCDSASNTAVAPAKCNGTGTCVVPNAISCGSYVCLPDNSACYPSCTGTSTGCKSPATCSGGSCGTKTNGTPCSTAPECTSGNCAPDGYCCDKPCTGKCEACDIGVNRGICTALTSGQPELSHGGNCAGFGTSCSGTCKSGNRTTCSFPGDGTVTNLTCATTSCKDSGTEYTAAQCNGAGACNAQTTMSCGGYICSGTACLTACSNNSDVNCAPNNYCNGTTCLSTRPAGRTCGGDGQCTLGHCNDGYCCSSDCSGQCTRCDVTPGTCTNVPNGIVPVNGRAACGTDSHCMGTCAGNGACGNFPSDTTSCNPGACLVCDGVGNCNPQSVCQGMLVCCGNGGCAVRECP
jgi:hypothetical protein